MAVNICDLCPDPMFSQMNPVANCEAAAKFLGPWLSKRQINYDALIEYGKSFGGTAVPDIGVLSWFICARDCRNEEFNNFFIHTPALFCIKEICKEFEWEGNADIVGIGMIVVYILGGVLSSLYLSSFLRLMMRRGGSTFMEPELPPEESIWHKITSALYNSFGEFHNGLTVLTLSVSIASLDTIRREESMYNIEMGWLASAILTAMFFLTLPIRYDVERRRKSAILFGLLVFVLFLASHIAARKAIDKIKGHPRYSLAANGRGATQAFEDDCYKLSTSPDPWLVVSGLYLGGIACLGFGVIIVLCINRTGKSAHDIPVIQLLARIPGRLVYCLFFFILMWTTCGILINRQSDIAQINGKAIAEDESKWGFGQVLALATWFPVLEEAIIIGWKKARSAQQGRMNNHFSAVLMPHDATEGRQATPQEIKPTLYHELRDRDLSEPV